MWTTRWPGFPDISIELNRLREEMNRALGTAPRAERTSLSGTAFPPLNVWDDDDAVFVEAEIPGIELDQIEIFVNGDDQLTIQGERTMPAAEGTWHRKERSFGKFSRMLRLPHEVDATAVTADFKDGVLTITLPKKEEVKPRRIQIKTA